MVGNSPADIVAYLLDQGDPGMAQPGGADPWPSIIVSLKETDGGARGATFEHMVGHLEEDPANQIRSAVYTALRKRFAQRQPGAPTSIMPALKDEKAALPQARIEQALARREMGDAELLADMFGRQILYDHAEQIWYLWNGQHWEKDRVRAIVPLVSTQLSNQYLAIIRKAQADENSDLAKQCTRRVEYLCSRRYLENVLTLAATLPLLRITGDEWDANPWILGVSNGVIDLRDGSIRAGQPEDMLRRMCPVEWTGLGAPAPLWEKFMRDVFNDDHEIILFVQRLLGYGVTGLSTEHVFPVLWGDGRNGKSTLLETLATVLGKDTASSIPSDSLMLSRSSSNNTPQPFIYQMRGKRIVWANETNPNRYLDASQVKMLTGGDQITVRTLHTRPVTFLPTHLLLLLTNHKPKAPAEDQAIWDRVALIAFEQRFVTEPKASNEHLRDATIGQKLALEGNGILAWLVKGCLDWQSNGLSIPAKIKLDSNAYRSEEDTISQFIDEHCVVGPDCYISSTEIYKAYVKWAKDFRVYPLGHREFAKVLSKRFQKGHRRDGSVYLGVGLPIRGGLFAWQQADDDGESQHRRDD